MDFLEPNGTVTYEFHTIPDSDFRIEFSAHDVAFQKLENTTGVRIGLVGYQNK